MHRFSFRKILFLSAWLFLYSCTTTKKAIQSNANIGSLKARAQVFRFAHAPENSADQPVQGEIVQRRERVRDDQVGNEAPEFIGRCFFVLVDVQDHVRRLQGTNLFEIDRLGAADFGDRAHRFFRMDAKAGAPDELLREAQVAHQLVIEGTRDTIRTVP